MNEPLDNLQFRPMTREDIPLFAQWLQTEHVARWWRNPLDLEDVERKYGPRADGTDPTKMYIVEGPEKPIGMIWFHLLSDERKWAEDNREAVPNATGVGGIDYIIGDANFIGRGVGTFMIKTFVQKIFNEHPDVRSIISDPQQENIASWKALEKAGFVRIFAGMLVSDDPSDSGPSYIYEINR